MAAFIGGKIAADLPRREKIFETLSTVVKYRMSVNDC
jgi:hypothetical protein